MGYVQRHFCNNSTSDWKVTMSGDDYTFLSWNGNPRFPNLPQKRRNPIVLTPNDEVYVKFRTSDATKSKGRRVEYRGSHHRVEGAGTVELINESNGNRVKFEFGVGGTNTDLFGIDCTQAIFHGDGKRLADNTFSGQGVTLNITPENNECIGGIVLRDV